MATTQASGHRPLEDLVVVDADSHLSTATDTLLEYVPRENAARRVLEDAGHVGSDVFTNTRASPAFPNDNAGYEGGGDDPARTGADTPEGKLRFMEQFGLDHSVLTPDVMLATINHDQTAVALARAYNDWLLDTFAGVDDRLHATMAVAHQVPEKAREEIERVGDEDLIVGVQHPAAGMVPPAGHRWHDPTYEAASELGLPIVMHSHDVQAAVTFPVQRRWSETFTESHAFTFPVELMWHLISMVCNGVPERYPELEFVFQEPGFEWVPWMMWRLDDHYLQNSRDLPALTRRPSEYIRDQFYFTTQPLGHVDDAKQMGQMMELAGGADTLLFSTDHPHPDFDPPEEVFRPARSRLEPDGVEGLMGGTAADVFGIEL